MLTKPNSSASAISLTMALMVSFASIVSAETLYQWKEADGSLTFSPTPPPEGSGIEYRLMNTGGGSEADISLPEETLSASQFANSQAILQPGNQISSQTGSSSILAGSTNSNGQDAGQPPLAKAEQQSPAQINYAPDAERAQRNALPQGISRADGSLNEENPVNAQQTSENEQQNSELMASKQKSAQCADLGKRIIALENRVTRSKTAQEMDDAILQISRYQRSYNSHCG